VRVKINGQALNQSGGDEHFCKRLTELLQPLENGCAVVLDYRNELASCDIQLDDVWRINPTDEQLQELRYAFGEDAVELQFG
jgi:DNA polymerase-3 subunit alpha